MATQTVNMTSVIGTTLFELTETVDDSAVDTAAASLVSGNLYTAAFTDVPAGIYRIYARIGATRIISDTITLAAVTGTYYPASEIGSALVQLLGDITAVVTDEDGNTGWPTEPLVIGDGYTTANGRAFRVTLYDANGSSLTTLGDQSFSNDAEFVFAVRGTSTTILSGTVTWVPTSGATPGHFLVQFPTTQTALASPLTKYTGRLILWPETVHRATALEQCFEFIEEIA